MHSEPDTQEISCRKQQITCQSCKMRRATEIAQQHAPVVSEPAMKKMRYSSIRRCLLSGLPSGSFSDSRWPA